MPGDRRPRRLNKRLIVCVLIAACARLSAQAARAPAPGLPKDVSSLRVCCRPLPEWSSSRNWFLFALNRLVVNHLHHCYIDFGEAALVPGVEASFQTSGIHPTRSHNGDKQPMPDQITDTLALGGTCKKVEDATPEKVNLLRQNLARGTCKSCGAEFHNRLFTLCFNNSNTYVYDLIAGAGMTPPRMKGVPGYRRHHSCGTQSNGTKPKS